MTGPMGTEYALVFPNGRLRNFDSDRVAAVRVLHARGLSQSAMAEVLDVSRATVRRYLAHIDSLKD